MSRPKKLALEMLTADLAGGQTPNLVQEARRQSLLVSHRRSEREALAFLTRAADTRDWK